MNGYAREEEVKVQGQSAPTQWIERGAVILPTSGVASYAGLSLPQRAFKHMLLSHTPSQPWTFIVFEAGLRQQSLLVHGFVPSWQ